LAKLAELQAATGNAHDAAVTRARLRSDYGTTLARIIHEHHYEQLRVVQVGI